LKYFGKFFVEFKKRECLLSCFNLFSLGEMKNKRKSKKPRELK